jgi:succinate dehydrogenase flavin-adding protein (antitoxin of CptAB toxin-antitoxin module)
MPKLRIGIVDLVARGRSRTLYGRIMHANLASIMPQILGAWCEAEGHEVYFVVYTGFEDLSEELPKDLDLLFISAFSQSAQVSYALSNMFRQRGAVTVLGGPHARCYPEDSQKYFDYVLGFTDRDILKTVLEEHAPHRPLGRRLAAANQPQQLPSLAERWKFIDQTLQKAPTIKLVPMLASLGCPYTCSFCIDSTVDYQPLEFAQLKEDLQFLRTKMKRPRVGWHDPNFGIRFEPTMDAIESAVPIGSIDFLAESSLSLLSEPHLKRLQKNAFQAILPGVESWYDLGGKSKTGSNRGLDKVKQVSEHINLVMKYVPYVQANFVFGLDGDAGKEPFELTKEFINRSPGTFPGYSLLTAFGRAAPLNLEYQKAGRVLPFPFHFLNNNHAMNVKPLNYSWPDFYDGVIDVTSHTFSKRAIFNRFNANRGTVPKWMNFVRAVSSEGFGRLKYYRTVRGLLDTDRHFRAYFEGETTELHPFYVARLKHDLGPLWDYLPEGSLQHDAHAYLNSMPAPVPATTGHKAEAVAAARKVAPTVVGAGAAAR